MIFAPLLPPLLIALIGAALAALAVWRYRTHWLLLGLRLAAVAVLVWILANPVRVLPRPQAMPTSALIVLDTSGSMAKDDGNDAGETRLAVARRAALGLGDHLRQADWQITSLSLVDELQAGFADTADGDSDFAALATLGTHQPAPDAVVLISDGADWRGRRPEIALAETRIPVHVLAVGKPGAGANCTLAIESTSPTAFPGQELGLVLALSSSGALVGETAEVVLDRIDPAKGTATTVIRQRVKLELSQRFPVTVPVGETFGPRLWRATVTCPRPEASTDDNIAFASAQVVDRTIRIRVIEGQPWWDTTFAVRAWRRDRQIEVTTAFALGAKPYRSGPAKSALDAAALGEIDVIVLGRGAARLLDDAALAAVATWLRAGGQLIQMAPAGGEHLAHLDELLPLTLTGDAGEVRVAGSTAQRGALLGGADPAKLRPVRCAAVGEIRPHARILLGDTEHPLLIQRRADSGLVTSVNMSGMWRWQLGDPEAENALARMWRQLVKGDGRSVRSLLRPYRLLLRQGEEAEITLALAADAPAPAATVTAPDGVETALAAVNGMLRFAATKVGLWRVRCGGEEVTLVVNSDQRERLMGARDDVRLGAIADATGGTLRDVREWKSLADLLGSRQRLRATVRSETAPVVLEWWWFLLATGLLACEWFLRRRRYGMA